MCRLRLAGEERFLSALNDDARGAAMMDDCDTGHCLVYSVDDGVVDVILHWDHGRLGGKIQKGGFGEC